MSTQKTQKTPEQRIPGMVNRRERFQEVEHAENAGKTLRRVAVYFFQEKAMVLGMLAAVVFGTPVLHGASVRSTDLRGGAALCVAALGAEGVTRVGALHHIDRGYEDIARDLSALGADIVREETEQH